MKGNALILGMLLCGCWLEAAAQSTVFDFSGRVTDKAGKGIANVVVNDGYAFTKTDGKGAWALTSDTTRSKYVTISVPAAYNLPQQEGLAEGYYVSVGQLATKGGKHDFVLEKRRKQEDSFHYIAISDPQVTNAAEVR